MLELLQQSHFIEDIVDLFGVFASQLYFLDDIILALCFVMAQVGISESPDLCYPYPWPMIFKFSYCFIKLDYYNPPSTPSCSITTK